jgi:hypothetical protein
VAVFDRGQVSSSQWVTEYTLRDVGSTETRRVTSLQDIEDLCRFMFPFTFQQARIMRDTISVQGACSYRAFTRDRGVTKYLHIPYVEPGAPLPPEHILFSRYWYGDEDEEDEDDYYDPLPMQTTRIRRTSTLGEGVLTMISNAEELMMEVIRRRSIAPDGPVLVDPSAIDDMTHFGLLATVVLSPDGPTVHTISVASFDGRWDANSTVMLWRRLNPFTEDRIQVLTRLPIDDLSFPPEILNYAVGTFIASNGRSPASVEWAKTFLTTVPSGVVITHSGRELEWLYPLAFQHLFQNMEASLDRIADGLQSIGPDFGNDILELESWTEPPVMTKLDFSSLCHSEPFSRWWGLISSDAYQGALYQQVPEAWQAAIDRFPGQISSIDVGNFLKWWKLFLPAVEAHV